MFDGKSEAGEKIEAVANAFYAQRAGQSVIFDFGEWQAEAASKSNPDGSVSFVTITPGIDVVEMVVGPKKARARTLIFRDAQHEYVFAE